MTSTSNQRIAKNTLFLYIRMFITMVVALYTSRIVLKTLGIEDYGIYNVVGGVVSMFSFITQTMAAASQRYLAFAIGKKDRHQLNKTFSVIFTIYLIFAVIIVLLGETVGLWFVKTKLTIPHARLEATLWVYHFSIFSFLATIIRIPYNAAIIAHEKMGFYAWSSIIEVIMKLLIVFLLIWFNFDKLILYSILTLIVIVIITAIYNYYCRLNFRECRYRFIWDKRILASMLGFSGWTLFDSLANVAKNQGINILLNIFFTPTINAARGIAYQISSQIMSFVGNFQIASSPQITKYFASKELSRMKTLYYQSSRLSFYLLFFISLPALIGMRTLLDWWLVDVPEYTLVFARLVVINNLINCMAGTSNSIVQATGKIKYYQIFSGTMMLLNLPISFVFLKLGYSPEITLIISIALSILIVLGRLYIVEYLIDLKFSEYIKNVFLSNILIGMIASIIPIFLQVFLSHSIYKFILTILIALFSTLLTIYHIGLKNNEKAIMKKYLRNTYLRKSNSKDPI